MTQLAKCDADAINRLKRHATTLYKEQGGIVLIKAGKTSEFVTTSECTVEKLREWYCNRDLRKKCTLHKVRGEGPEEREFDGEAQGRTTQLSQAFQRGTRVSGQVVVIRVLERPDKWDGR